MTIEWENNNDCILYNLQNRLLNLTYLKIYINGDFFGNLSNLEIKVNKICKINDFYLFLNNGNNAKFYCASYEDLIKVNLSLESRVENIKDCFPIFNDKCKVIFKSLIDFNFYMPIEYEINLALLKNIYNNLDNMPNLKKILF